MEYRGLVYLGWKPGKDLDRRLQEQGLEKYPFLRRFKSREARVRIYNEGFPDYVADGIPLQAAVAIEASTKNAADGLFELVHDYAIQNYISRRALGPGYCLIRKTPCLPVLEQ